MAADVSKGEYVPLVKGSAVAPCPRTGSDGNYDNGGSGGAARWQGSRLARAWATSPTSYPQLTLPDQPPVHAHTSGQGCVFTDHCGSAPAICGHPFSVALIAAETAAGSQFSACSPVAAMVPHCS